MRYYPTVPVKIPNPADLNIDLPSWRPGQEEALSVTVTSEKRCTGLCAPTGFGKSAVNVATALITGEPTCIVTMSRGLQDQYLKEFSHLGMVDLRGRRNYECDMRPEFTCEEGHAAGCPNKGTVACSASAAEMRAATSPLVVTNYAKWCASKKYGMGMQHFTQVIFDEGHLMYDALADAMQVILYAKEINETLKIDFPDQRDEFPEWKPWASAARAEAERAMLEAKAKIDGVANPKPSWVKKYTHMRNLSRRLATLSTARAKDWIVEELENGYQFDPIRPGRYAEAALLFRIPRVISVSATNRPKSLYMVGFSKDSFEFFEFDSDFDPKRCPIYYVPTMRVDSRASDLRELWLRLDQIMSRRTDRKGIVQTTSYAYQQAVIQNSRFSPYMIVNNKGEAPTEIIDIFRDSGPGTTLVSPSVGTGYDFAMQDAEWQFFVKLPFDPPSKILKAREADDPEYRPYRTMNKFVQGVGRIMRSKKDQGENFIGDKHAEWFIPRYRHLAPKSFHGFYKTVRTLPPPPPKL